MKDQLSDEQVGAILKALDGAIEQWPSSSSHFLEVTRKKLQDIREDFFNQTQTIDQENKDLKKLNNDSLESTQQEVFIALYSSQGGNLQSWERIVTSLPTQSISRAIYANEEDLKAIIKTKENKNNEAYLGIYINKSDILSVVPDKVLMDKLGKPLLSLKNKALILDNITRFVHQSDTYQYRLGKLVKT